MRRTFTGLPLVTTLIVALAGGVLGSQDIQMAPAAPLPDGPLVFDAAPPSSK